MSNLTGRRIYQKGAPRKSKALRDDARGRECTLQIPGVCSHDPEQTVGCHLRLFGFGGMGMKPDDVFILDACSACHDVQEHRHKWEEHGLDFEHILRALMITLQNRRNAGLIEVK